MWRLILLSFCPTLVFASTITPEGCEQIRVSENFACEKITQKVECKAIVAKRINYCLETGDYMWKSFAVTDFKKR